MFTSEEAEERAAAGENVILVRPMTVADDVGQNQRDHPRRGRGPRQLSSLDGRQVLSQRVDLDDAGAAREQRLIGGLQVFERDAVCRPHQQRRHGGGLDLVFPHHEDEIAQSEAATGEPFVHTWLHNAHLHTGGAKMAKSTGNIARPAELYEAGDGDEPLGQLCQLDRQRRLGLLGRIEQLSSLGGGRQLEGLAQVRPAGGLDLAHGLVDGLCNPRFLGGLL